MKISFDIISKTFSVTGTLGAFGGVLGFGFNEGGSLPVDLQSVSKFGFTLGGVTEKLPKYGKLNSTTLEIVHQHTANLRPNTEYTLDFFVEMPEYGTVQGSHNFTTPKPNAPYVSWVWNDTKKCYEPPVIKPDGDFIWDEPTGSWVPDPQSALNELNLTDAVTGARVSEDLFDVLIAKGLISEADLPQATIDRIDDRKTHRQVYTNSLS